MAFGTPLWLAAYAQLGRNVTFEPATRESHTLATRGPCAYVRRTSDTGTRISMPWPAVAHPPAGAFRPCATLARAGLAVPLLVWRWAPLKPRTSWRRSRCASLRRALRSRCNLARGGAWGRRACGGCAGLVRLTCVSGFLDWVN
ncbi:hypothetical protein PsYK624_154150 [Phanerochaete sordida]|uniref:Uncharacterized protein n=1 Tax=Phanerochaete sordida TaxID=48140 RepID=A0A9P3GNT5_9APHY|nr:hypothetical protein PsYK624_154150 [Phanerochaete sordida]